MYAFFCRPEVKSMSVIGRKTVLVVFSAFLIETFETEDLDVSKNVPPETLASCQRADFTSEMPAWERCLHLLGRGLVWLHADVYGQFGIMAVLCAEDAKMFGSEGADEVIKLKQKWLMT